MKKWLFVFCDIDTIPFCTDAIDLKAAVLHLADYTGNSHKLFTKALSSMTTSDEIIALYNHFDHFQEIQTVYQIESVVYQKEEGKKNA